MQVSGAGVEAGQSSRAWLWPAALRWLVRSILIFVAVSAAAYLVDGRRPSLGLVELVRGLPALTLIFGGPMLLGFGLALVASLARGQSIFRVAVVGSVVVFVWSWEWMFLDTASQAVVHAVLQLGCGGCHLVR